MIEGQPGLCAAGQRTAGFAETITASGTFRVVAAVPAHWSREEAVDSTVRAGDPTGTVDRFPVLTGA